MTAIGQTDQRYAAKPRSRGMGMERSLKIWGFIFLAPWIIGFFAFTFIPMVASLLFSFTDFNLLRPDDVQYIGWANYSRLFADPQVQAASAATLRYALIALPIAVLAPIGMAGTAQLA